MVDAAIISRPVGQNDLGPADMRWGGPEKFLGGRGKGEGEKCSSLLKRGLSALGAFGVRAPRRINRVGVPFECEFMTFTANTPPINKAQEINRKG